MAKKFYNADGDKNHLYFFCPGCGCDHWITLSGDKHWSFDGNNESPTVTPSIRVFRPKTEDHPEQTICHFYINHGQIQYLNDCVHRLAGQSVDMKDVD